MPAPQAIVHRPRVRQQVVELVAWAEDRLEEGETCLISWHVRLMALGELRLRLVDFPALAAWDSPTRREPYVDRQSGQC